MISRRQLMQGAGVAGLGLLVECGRLPWQAQSDIPQAQQVHRIGLLGGAVTSGPELFRQAMRELGYIEGENYTLEVRLATDADENWSFARELVSLCVELIVTSGLVAALAAREATSTIPIVNVGIVSTELAGKRLQLLTDVMPGASRVGVIWGSALPIPHGLYALTAGQLGLQLRWLEMHTEDEVERALQAVSREKIDALEIRQGPLANRNRARIAELAIELRLPTIGESLQFTDAGALMTYAPRTAELWHRAAAYVDRILKGANPAELPIERPTAFDFVINLKTAQALGLTIPQHVLLQATEIIQ